MKEERHQSFYLSNFTHPFKVFLSNVFVFYFRMTCNKLRLAILQEESNDLADLMCHSTNMQQSTYNNFIRSNKADVRSSKIVRKILTNAELTQDDIKLPEIGKLIYIIPDKTLDVLEQVCIGGCYKRLNIFGPKCEF